VPGKSSNGAIIFALAMAVFLWGASNVGTKYLVATWPPVWIGSTRLGCAGLVLLAGLRWTPWFGKSSPLTPTARQALWVRGGLSLAIYIVVFNLALHLTTASHVALYLGTAPVWALVWEERPSRSWRSARRYGAAALALTGVVVLFWPALQLGNTRWIGEALGMSCGLLWAVYGRQCRFLGASLSGAEVSAHTLWRAGVVLAPFALAELIRLGVARKAGFILLRRDFWRPDLLLAQGYCILGGGVFAYALWNHGLRHWPTSQVFLFNNLVPLSTMLWSHFCLGEPVTRTFWTAMALIVAGVALGQGRWEKILGARWTPEE
jgi:drug/metabolite transporter (DMT)-like permease